MSVFPGMAICIAVLGFNLFADGVTEEILNTLAGLKDLKVTARTSA